MSIAFNGNTIPGVWESWKWGTWERPVQRNSIFGRDGATQISGGRHTRTIRIPGWIYNEFETPEDLSAYLTSLEEEIGTVATLASDGTVTRSVDDCDFSDVEYNETPIPSDNLGWFADVVLVFTQLKP